MAKANGHDGIVKKLLAHGAKPGLRRAARSNERDGETMIFAMGVMKTKLIERVICMASRAPPYRGKPMLRLFQGLQHGLVPNG